MRTKNPGRHEGPRAAMAAGVLLLLTLAGCGGATNGVPDAGSAPPSSATASAAATTAAPDSAAPAPPQSSPAAASAAAEPAVLPRSEPLTLDIPVIGLRTDLLKLGLRENGSLDVPPTGSGAPASWYNGSPTPGERGPSVMLGHVNALGGATGVFADLRKLAPGTDIQVSRADGTTAVFTVDHGAQYSKDAFPTLEVYGNTPGAELRLITCDGYDPATRLFDDNYVIYAKLKV